MPDLSARRRDEEWMDRSDVDPAELLRSLVYIRRVNTWLRYTRATIGHLARFSRGWMRGEPIHIVDFATGSADVPRATLRWAGRHGHDVRVVGIDLHPLTARAALDGQPREPRLSIVRADALRAPFADGSFDYALCSMFLHHLSDDDAVRVLREMDRVARRGIIAADLLRTRRAYAWISLFTLLARPMIKHDARVSVAQAFSAAEVEGIGRAAGVDYARYHAHFAHRFALAGERRRRGSQFEHR